MDGDAVAHQYDRVIQRSYFYFNECPTYIICLKKKLRSYPLKNDPCSFLVLVRFHPGDI